MEEERKEQIVPKITPRTGPNLSDEYMLPRSIKLGVMSQITKKRTTEDWKIQITIANTITKRYLWISLRDLLLRKVISGINSYYRIIIGEQLSFAF